MFETKLLGNNIEKLKYAVQVHELLDFSEDLNFHFIKDIITIQSYHSTYNLIISFKFADEKLVVNKSSDETVVTVKRSNLKRALAFVTIFYPCTLKYEKDTIKFTVNSSKTAYNVVSIKAISSYKLTTIYGCEMHVNEHYDICNNFDQSSLINISVKENSVVFCNPYSDEVSAEYFSFSKENDKDKSTILNEKTIFHQIPVSFVKRIADVFLGGCFNVVIGSQQKAEKSESYALLLEYNIKDRDINNFISNKTFDSIKKNFPLNKMFLTYESELI